MASSKTALAVSKDKKIKETSKKVAVSSSSKNGNGAAKSVAKTTNGASASLALVESVVAIEVEEVATLDNLEFQQGDKVVYPPHGVGIVESIQLRHVMGREMKFYHINFPELQATSMVSVVQAKNVGLRRVVDHNTVDKVYDILRDRKVVINTQTWNRRQREYSQKIKTGSVLEIARVIRDLSVLRGDKELSFGERRMLDTAQKLLVKELSIAKARSEDTIRQELDTLCHV